MKKNLKILPQNNIFYRLTDISATQRKLQYDTRVAIQDNAVQHWWYNTILEANTISNIGKLAKTVYSDSFRVELSSLILRKLMIADRYAIRMTNYPRHPLPYLQPMIITSLALPMHHLQNTVSQTGYPNNKEGDLFIRSEMETNARPGSIRSYVNRFLWLKR